jgi:predicted enzyme related to lactoylglutathione lyase
MTDPFDALRLPDQPVDPDPAFGADLRARLARVLLASPQQESQMTTNSVSRSEFRNGLRDGDVSYVTLAVPDLDRAKAFYGAVLGWSYSAGSDPLLGAQVEAIAPMTGLWAGAPAVGTRTHGAVLGYRVADLASAVGRVRAAGGTVSDPHQEPYGLVAEGLDNQGIEFYLHEMPELTGSSPMNGSMEGDLSYITLVVPDLDKALEFYAVVVGWTFNVGRLGGAQVNNTLPQIGMGAVSKDDELNTPGAVLGYRVDDIEATTERVRAAGGTAGPVERRPYGLESLAADDQGTAFYLHQLGES